MKQLSQQATESSVSPVVSSVDTEVFEELATDGANEKLYSWFTYVDETFVTWKRGPENLSNLLWKGKSNGSITFGRLCY